MNNSPGEADLKAGTRLTVTIEKPAAGGRMIARHDGRVLLVAGAIPGETAEVAVERVQRGTVWASVVRVIDPSSDRVDAGPDWACGGSVFAHVGYERQLLLKADIVQDAFARLARLPLEVPFAVTASPVDGYRMRARLHVRQGRIGFFREGSHELCAAGPTRQLSAAAMALVDELADALRTDPQARVTEVEIAENVAGTERACHLDLGPNGDPSRLAAAVASLAVTGLSCAAGADARSLIVRGDPRVADTLEVTTHAGDAATATLTRQARSFFQGNRFLLDALAQHVGDAVPDGPVVDLYAGVGLFAVTRAARGGVTVTAVEGDRWAAEDLRNNASPFEGTIVTRRGAVEALAPALPRAEQTTVVVDPPRTGLSREAARLVAGWRARRLVYVSCDVATLARDARIMVDAGYRIVQATGFDLFPNTAHIETVMVFDRAV